MIGFTTVQDQTTITATVPNDGAGPTSGVPVRFTATGAQIGAPQKIASIPAGVSGTASVVRQSKGLERDDTIAASVPLAPTLTTVTGAAQVRIVLLGGPGGATFDNLGKWEA